MALMHASKLQNYGMSMITILKFFIPQNENMEQQVCHSLELEQ